MWQYVSCNTWAYSHNIAIFNNQQSKHEREFKPAKHLLVTHEALVCASSLIGVLLEWQNGNINLLWSTLYKLFYIFMTNNNQVTKRCNLLDNFCKLEISLTHELTVFTHFSVQDTRSMIYFVICIQSIHLSWRDFCANWGDAPMWDHLCDKVLIISKGALQMHRPIMCR